MPSALCANICSMRWSNLTVDGEERTSLPGYRDEAVVRHFEAPGSIKTRFYEVRAKSILNRVPEASQMPFRWTVNPYRGCTHACLYCLWGGTPVLTGDGRHRPIESLKVGDEIFGTAQRGPHREYVHTVVLDTWITVKPAYRVVLADGTELIASGDHRFLSSGGWKHVLNAPRSEPDRPHLTVQDSLAGTGAFERQPEHSTEYRRGYLSGIARGDGTVAHFEALRRARGFLAAEGIATGQRLLARAAGAQPEIPAIHTDSGHLWQRIRDAIEWPEVLSCDWGRGFLGAVFDAEGSRGAFGLRIVNPDPDVLALAERCLSGLGFDPVLYRTGESDGLAHVGIRGGLREHLRFLHLTDPAVNRKRSIEGEMVKTSSELSVAAIEPLGRALPLYDITTGTGDFIANGVVSHNCFARPTHKYLDFDVGRDFEREIVVKVNAPERLRAELARPSWEGEHVALGTNTDPYQWVEGRYKLMRGIWEAMRDTGNPCSILTKSPLLLRDLDLMRQIADRTDFSAALSVPTLDEKAWRATEPHTPHPRARLEAVAELKRAGLRVGVLVAPLMPGINDSPDQVAAILELAAEAGADYVSGIALHLRGEVKGLFFEWLQEHRPDLLEHYGRLYRRGAYAPNQERKRLAGLVRYAGGGAPSFRVGTRKRAQHNTPQAGPARDRGSQQTQLF